MIKYLLFNFGKHFLFDRNAALKTSIYLLLIIGLVWLSIANYYYYSGQWQNFCGALTSSLIFLGTAVCVKIYCYYNCKKHSLTEKFMNINPLVSLASQPMLNLIYHKAKNLAKENKLASFMLIGAVGLTTIYAFFNLMHDREK